MDGLRGDHLGYRGYPRPVSPFLDELAGQSVDFERAYAASAGLLSSYGSLLTSLHPDEHELFAFEATPLDASATTLAQVLTDRGYRTAAFLGTRAEWEGTQLARGFETVDVPHELHPRPYRAAGETVDRALEWLSGLNSEDRTFVFLQFADVGTRGQAGPEHFEQGLVGPDRREMVEFVIERYRVPYGFFHYEDLVLLKTYNRYDAEVHHIDAEIARLYRGLDAGGWNEDAVWILASPFGMGLGNHLYRGAGRHIYESQVRTPLWIHTPGGEIAARVIDEPVAQMDLAPTVLELAGGDVPPASWRGRSLAPLLAGETLEPRAILVQRGPVPTYASGLGEAWASDAELSAIVDERWKLLRDTSGAEELYDVVADPFELDERSGSAPEGEVERLRQELSDRLAELEAGTGG